MIERLRLPNSPFAAEDFIDRVGGGSLDCIHNLSKRMNFHRVVIDQGCEDHVHMIRHHDRDSQVELASVVMQAGLQDYGPNPLG